MSRSQLPTLPEGVEYLGKHVEAQEEVILEGGLKLPILRARYRVHGLTVAIGWIIGHPMGNFREPNSLSIEFDSYDHALGYDKPTDGTERRPFDGITTSVLRAIPLAHAKALMQERYEQISVADIRRRLKRLPSRVETDYDYAHVAAAYVALAAVSIEPVKRLSEWSDESVETWSARLRRARAKGILVGKGRVSQVAPSLTSFTNGLWTDGQAGKDSSSGS